MSVGRPQATSFPARRHTADSLDVERLRTMILAVHHRLARVTIEQLDYGDFLRTYDHPGALFYLDPPYRGCEDIYGPNLFTRDDFARLATSLAGLKGRFLLSLNDNPEIRRLFSRFRIDEEPVTYTVAGKPKRVVELVISG